MSLNRKKARLHPAIHSIEFLEQRMFLSATLLSATAPTVITDDNDPTVTYVGHWWSSGTGAGYNGTDFRNDGNQLKGGSFASFPLRISSDGVYSVFARWPGITFGAAATNAVFDVTTSAGVTTVFEDQTASAGQWVLLGNFNLSASNAAVTIRNDNTTGILLADAVGAAPTTDAVTQPPPPPPVSIVVDDDDRNVAYLGNWWSSGAGSGFYAGDFRNDGNQLKGHSSVTFTPQLPTGGTYQVSMRWPSARFGAAASNVPVDIVTSSGTVTVTVDETQNSGQWVSLGSFDLSPATAAVRVRNDGTSGLVLADAVGFNSASIVQNPLKLFPFPANITAAGRYTIAAHFPALSFTPPGTVLSVDIITSTGKLTTTVSAGGDVTLGTYDLDPATAAIAVHDTGDNIPDSVTFTAAAPLAPSNFAATAVSTSEIDLTWTNNTPSASTVVQYGAPTGVGSSVTLAPGVNFYHATGLTSGSAYTFSIQSTQNGLNSAAVITGPLTTLIAAPSNFSPTIVSPTEIDLAWIDNAPQAGLVLQYAIGGSSQRLPLASLPAGSTNFAATMLSPGTSYTFFIQAVQGVLSSSTVSTAPVQTPFVAPLAPSHFAVTSVSATQIGLAWVNNTPTAALNLSFASPGGAPVSLTLSAGTHTFTVINLAPDTSYTFTLTAVQNSLSSPPVSTTATTNHPAVLTITDRVDQMTAPDSTDSGATSAIDVTSNTAASYRISFFLSVAGLSGSDVGFGNVALDLSLGGNLNRDAAAGRQNYQPENAPITIDGAGDTAPQWDLNSDVGTPNDLKAILVSLASHLAPNDPRIGGDFGLQPASTLDQSTGYVGSVWVTFPGNTAASLGAFHLALTPGSAHWSTLQTDGSGKTILVAHNDLDNYRVVLPADITFGTAPLIAPSNLTAMLSSSSTAAVDLSWTNNTPGASISLQYSSTNGVSQAIILPPGTDMFEVTGLTRIGSYIFSIAAVSGTATSPIVTADSVFVFGLPPAAPSNVTATVVSPIEVDLTWTQSSTDVSQSLLQYSSDGSIWDIGNAVLSGSTSGSITSLKPSTAYYFRVLAFNGQFSRNNPVVGPIQMPNAPAPSAPSNFTAAAVSPTEIDLSWTEATPGATFFLQYSVAGTNNWIVKASGFTATSYAITGLTPDTQYLFSIHSVANNLSSDEATAGPVQTPVPVPPAAPINFTGYAFSDVEIDLSWTNIAANGSLIVQYTGSDGSSASSTFPPGTSRAFAIHLNALTNYTFTLTASLNGLTSDPVTLGPIQTFSTIPAAPSKLVASTVSPTQVDLSWTNDDSAAILALQYSSAGGQQVSISLPPGTSSYSVIGLTPATLYTFSLSAVRNSHSSDIVQAIATTQQVVVLTITDVVDRMAAADSSGAGAATGIDITSNSAASYRISFFLHVTGLSGNDIGFGNIALDFGLTNLRRDAAPARNAYQAENAAVVIDADGDVASQWGLNADVGTPNDLKAILISLAGGLAPDDPRIGGNFGLQPASTPDQTTGYIGSVWVTFPGNTSANTGLFHLGLTPGSAQWSTVQVNASGNTVFITRNDAIGYPVVLPPDILFGTAVTA
jgi:hypothetical protein